MNTKEKAAVKTRLRDIKNDRGLAVNIKLRTTNQRESDTYGGVIHQIDQETNFLKKLLRKP